MNPQKHVIMVASENDALIGGKFGGVGDVVNHLPRALASIGWTVTVVTPSYGFLHKRNPSEILTRVKFPFRGKELEADVWRVQGKQLREGVNHLVIEHEQIRGDPIYYNDPPETPFVRDATKYSLFCSAVGRLLSTTERPAVLHLHDWHAAALFLLRELHPAFSHLKGIHTSFTIHNLAIQGTRPMRELASSLEGWFPELFEDTNWIAQWKDPRYRTACYTPMAIGIKNAGKINTVSPTYAEEILMPSDHRRGYYGGEGLEHLLQHAKREDRLFGILNGCDYSNSMASERLTFDELCEMIHAEASAANAKRPDPYHDELLDKLMRAKALQPSLMMTAVMRVVEQKARLLFEHDGRGVPAIDRIMEIVSAHNGVCVVLGSGTSDYEHRLVEASRRHKQLIFIKGYFEKIADVLYTNGTMFLMPSSFEPCGISQMMAMREGQPCIVHAVGGLKDTVKHNVNGFTFSGKSLTEQVENFVRTVEKAVETFTHEPEAWKRIASAAMSERFTWEKSAGEYEQLIYPRIEP